MWTRNLKRAERERKHERAREMREWFRNLPPERKKKIRRFDQLEAAKKKGQGL
jgi:hypothetical protein